MSTTYLVAIMAGVMMFAFLASWAISWYHMASLLESYATWVNSPDRSTTRPRVRYGPYVLWVIICMAAGICTIKLLEGLPQKPVEAQYQTEEKK